MEKTMSNSIKMIEGNGDTDEAQPQDESSDINETLLQALQSTFSDNIHSPWTLDDDKLLLEGESRGKTVEILCSELKRGRGGVLSRLRALRDPKSKAFLRMYGDAREEEIPKSSQQRPVGDVLQRILWDPQLTVSDFTVGWNDRFNGVTETSCSSPNKSIKGKERKFIKALPEHRIEYVKYKERVVWSKMEDRFDLFFAGKIEKVIEEYNDWLDERERKQQKVGENIVLYCDLDGVLCDFEEGVRKLFGRKPAEVSPKLLWSKLAKVDNFFGELPWTERGKELWTMLINYEVNPILLSGVPNGQYAAIQKREWVDKNLGPDIKLITCKSKDKHFYARQSNQNSSTVEENEEIIPKKFVLIDDSLPLRDAWEKEGGIFIHYSPNAHDEIEDMLKTLYTVYSI